MERVYTDTHARRRTYFVCVCVCVCVYGKFSSYETKSWLFFSWRLLDVLLPTYPPLIKQLRNSCKQQIFWWNCIRVILIVWRHVGIFYERSYVREKKCSITIITGATCRPVVRFTWTNFSMKVQWQPIRWNEIRTEFLSLLNIPFEQNANHRK